VPARPTADRRTCYQADQADLRHAGVLEQAKALRNGTGELLALHASYLTGLDALDDADGYALPTSMQERFERAVALPADIPAHLRGPAKTEEE
jgi:hypothetical protein